MQQPLLGVEILDAYPDAVQGVGIDRVLLGELLDTLPEATSSRRLMSRVCMPSEAPACMTE
ncbi:MAG: hypothetical protein QM804_17510 [Propionicimonas sp.]